MEMDRKWIVQFYKTVIWGLFAAILFVLILFSANSTSYLGADALERTYFVGDHIWKNLVAAGSVVVMAVLVRRVPVFRAVSVRVDEDERFYKKCRNALLVTGFGLAVFWVISTQYYPGADQAQVQKAVVMLHIKDYSMFAEDGYIAMFPNQLGLVWFSFVLSLFVGSGNYLAFQLLNAVAVAVIYRELAEIAELSGQKRITQLVAIVLCILFFPLTMYTSFIYGNLLGLACALAALKQEMVFFRKSQKRNLIASVLLIVLAVQLKSNYLIFMIGMMIYAVIEGIKRKRWLWMAVPILLIFCHLAAGTAVIKVSEEVSGYELDQGASPWSWIAMGLQDGNRAPGWYNGYNVKSYKDSGFQTAIQAEAAKEKIRETIDDFSMNKEEAFRFFLKKTASQWNNPTFQSFWNVQIRSTAIIQSEWSWELVNRKGEQASVEYLNLYQFVILFGALLFCSVGRRGRGEERTVVPAMIFIGGFLFHLFWEAKCQYAISYFVLLIPYAAAGYGKLSEILYSVFGRKQKLAPRRILEMILEKHFAVLLFLFVLVNAGIFLGGNGYMNYLKEDTEVYRDYLEEKYDTPDIKGGLYYIEESMES